MPSGLTSEERLQALFNILQHFRNQNENVNTVLKRARINTVQDIDQKLFEPTSPTRNQDIFLILREVYKKLTPAQKTEMDEFGQIYLKGLNDMLGGSKLKKSKTRKTKSRKTKSRKTKKH